MLNDKFGIQTRGGCSCAGTYGHFLLAVSEDLSNSITSQISQGDCTLKPGWIRMSIHPTQSSEEIEFIVDGIKQLANNHSEWIEDYNIDLMKGSIKSKRKDQTESLENKIDLCFTESFV